MALDILKDITHIGGFEIIQEMPKNEEDMVNWKLFYEIRKTRPIYIDHDVNMISFRIQNGPIKEVGVNGCQVDALIETAMLILCGLNDKFPCEENTHAIACLKHAIFYLDERKINREERGVEGKSLS